MLYAGRTLLQEYLQHLCHDIHFTYHLTIIQDLACSISMHAIFWQNLAAGIFTTSLSWYSFHLSPGHCWKKCLSSIQHAFPFLKAILKHVFRRRLLWPFLSFWLHFLVILACLGTFSAFSALFTVPIHSNMLLLAYPEDWKCSCWEGNSGCHAYVSS